MFNVHIAETSVNFNFILQWLPVRIFPKVFIVSENYNIFFHTKW